MITSKNVLFEGQFDFFRFIEIIFHNIFNFLHFKPFHQLNMLESKPDM